FLRGAASCSPSAGCRGTGGRGPTSKSSWGNSGNSGQTMREGPAAIPWPSFPLFPHDDLRLQAEKQPGLHYTRPGAQFARQRFRLIDAGRKARIDEVVPFVSHVGRLAIL